MLSEDKILIRNRFAKHLEQYNIQSIAQLEICCRLGELMDNYVDGSVVGGGKGYEIGAGTGFLTKILLGKYPTTKWYINDIVEQTRSYLNNIIMLSEAQGVEFEFGDAEYESKHKELSIIASASAVQWFESTQGFIASSFEKLQGGGYLVFSTFGARNFIELTSIFGKSAIEYFSVEQIEKWAEDCGFEKVYSEDYLKRVYFESPHNVIRYIKETGINANSKNKWSKSDFENFCQEYSTRFTEQKGVSLTFNPTIFIFKKPL